MVGNMDLSAFEFGVGVGKEGFGWSGVAIVHDKQEWPDWYPPKEMLQRRPDILKAMSELQGGLGMRGGPLRRPTTHPPKSAFARAMTIPPNLPRIPLGRPKVRKTRFFIMVMSQNI